MTLLTIRIEGGLLSPDFLDTIHEQSGQKPVDFGLDARRSLVDEVTAVWSDVRAYWEAFERRRARAKDGESLTSATREAWIIPLLEALGYRLTFQRRAAEADGRSYAISHRAGDDEKGPPVHIVAFDQKLGERPPAGRGTTLAPALRSGASAGVAPHALVQDYLNRSDDTWGIVTNGATLRLLRDSVYFSRPSYIEFDLQGMLDGERLDEFILFYRLAHRTRLALAGEDGGRCLLESYHQAAVEQGGRIRDGLRKAVEGAIGTLANGFLSHPKNGDLRRAISNSELSATAYYQQLLYLIYRLLFLMVAEERNLLVLAESGGNGAAGGVAPPLQGRGDYYLDHYSITRLRRLAEAPLSGPQRFDDLFLSLRTLFRVLRDETQAPALGVPALNGELFDVGRTRHLEAAYLNNRDLLSAIRQLSYFTPEKEQVRRRVNYSALDVEELGSVYESLLDEYPIIAPLPGSAPAGGRPRFAFVQGTERKTTGSYYTARELVKETLDSALDPVIAERLKAAAESLRRSEPTARVREAQITALLAIRVCDSACGSGHFLLSAARRIGRALAQVATGEDEPSPEAVRHWTREAIIHCIYGVDKNPLAVDLCKVALWIEGHAPGKPLTFLDAHIKCGDSLVGVFDLKVLEDGIPDEAFDPVTGDDKPTARELKRRNKREREGQLGLAFPEQQAALSEAVRQWQAQLDSPEDTPAQVRKKSAAYRKLQQQEDTQRTACDLWTAAFFTPLTAENADAGVIPTTATLQDYRRQPGAADPRLVAHARALAVRNQFFHWPLEFPHVFAAGGFTVMLGNPPWERIKLQEQEFFAARDLEIAEAPNKAARGRLIEALPKIDPILAQEFAEAKRTAEATSKFVRQSGRFQLTAVGDVNSYALFAELVRSLLAPIGRAGIVVPTGIATDDTTKDFFGDLAAKQSLASFYDFENREAIFPGVHRSQKFCLLTISGRPVEQSQFVFYATRVEHLTDPQRRFTLAPDEITLFNPNTHTIPILRTRTDAELTKKIIQQVPILVNERTGENLWSLRFTAMIHMANDSGLFITEPDAGCLPLYEGKMVQAYDHRAASVVTVIENLKRPGQPVETTYAQLADPTYLPTPQYYVDENEVDSRLVGAVSHRWLLAYKSVTSPTNERTMIATALPYCAVAHSMNLILISEKSAPACACFLANTNSLILDYVAKQKVGGVNLSFFIVKQFPFIPPALYSRSDIAFIAPRILELVYTAWDMAPFAADLWADADEALRAKLEEQHQSWLHATSGHPWNPPDWAGGDACPAPFAPAKWDEDRRALLRAELDAYYARLYGLARDELRYILDPKDVYGPDFPGETFRVLKEKEERAFGEYRTRRLVLEAWDRLEAELGPVVVRNYREEMAATPGRVAETGPTYQATVRPATPAPLRFGAVQAPAPAAKPAPAVEPEPDAGQPALPWGGTAAAPAASAKTEPTRPTPRPEPAAQPVLIPSPPQGSRSQRLSRLLALGRQRTPEAIGELVAALGDEDEQLRWLAALSLQGIGGETVIATLRAFLERAPSAAARAEAARALEKLTDGPG